MRKRQRVYVNGAGGVFQHFQNIIGCRNRIDVTHHDSLGTAGCSGGKKQRGDMMRQYSLRLSFHRRLTRQNIRVVYFYSARGFFYRGRNAGAGYNKSRLGKGRARFPCVRSNRRVREQCRSAGFEHAEIRSDQGKRIGQADRDPILKRAFTRDKRRYFFRGRVDLAV